MAKSRARKSRSSSKRAKAVRRRPVRAKERRPTRKTISRVYGTSATPVRPAEIDPQQEREYAKETASIGIVHGEEGPKVIEGVKHCPSCGSSDIIFDTERGE